MTDELIQKARWQAKQQALDNPRTGTCDDANCSINIVLAAESGFDAGVRAERERLKATIKEGIDEFSHVYERLSWILAACTIDRDAKHEIEALLK